MKKITAITTAILLFGCFSTVSAHAGAARRHTVEGFMLGTGVAILSAAIINGIHRDSKRHYAESYARPARRHPARYDDGCRAQNHSKLKSHGPRGYWEIEKIWIAPVYKKKWNPGHYNRKGIWVSGRHEKFLIKQGYYREEKVWVRR
ncbi:hypothetical protein [Desulfobacula sp.]|uniref:hypothetical protein n=1 Tax=Desulfobacula sp. TaxID=2593537 RepID=UPI00260540FC|nr:hypothetical protein [Desulfobacula sp.]